MIRKLEDYIENLEKIAVAYSGGVDSTFLLATGARILGEAKVLALTIRSPLTPPWEVDFATEFCRTRAIKHLLLDGSFILDDDLFASNPLERCYFCKRKILGVVKSATPGDHALLTATNASDESDFRPGMKAEEEIGVRTPLRELRFTKQMIREYSKAYDIPGFERPPCACFATRIPCGEPITLEKVNMIAEAESSVRHLGIELVRVRLMRGDMACIEVGKTEIKKVFGLREQILRQLGDIGFHRVTLDLEGYWQGKLNYEASR